MYKFDQLMKLTPSKIRKNSNSIITFLIRAIWDMDSEGQVHRKVLMKARDTKTKRDTKIITCRFYGGNDNILKDRVWCHCSCEYFLYHVEVALTAQGSSSVINSNGNLPVETNPQMKGHLCKHLFKAATTRIPNLSFKAKKSWVTDKAPTETEIEEEMKKLL